MNKRIKNDIKRVLSCIKNWKALCNKQFRRDIREYRSKCRDGNMMIDYLYLFPCLGDSGEAAGTVDPHYFLQDIWMAKKVCENAPEIHYDIGSRVDGFIAHLITHPFLKSLKLIDIRPFPHSVEKLDFIRDDATTLHNIEDESIGSLSCLHAFEHFGLGRYGDPVDPASWKTALLSMERVLKKGGYLYLSVPCGQRERVCFNAHRVFDPMTIINTLSGLKLLKFAYIHDMKIYEAEAGNVEKVKKQMGDYDCGMFVFRKEEH